MSAHDLPHGNGYPHGGGCVACRMIHVCNACGGSIIYFHSHSRCTNGRCMSCHRRFCTPGGGTSPGHGYGNPTPEAVAKEIRGG